MNRKPYLICSGVVFGVMALGQFMRLIFQVPVQAGTFSIPLWLNKWLAPFPTFSVESPVLPEDVAQTVVFLLNERASQYTGAIFDINNGRYLR